MPFFGYKNTFKFTEPGGPEGYNKIKILKKY